MRKKKKKKKRTVLTKLQNKVNKSQLQLDHLKIITCSKDLLTCNNSSEKQLAILNFLLPNKLSRFVHLHFLILL